MGQEKENQLHFAQQKRRGEREREREEETALCECMTENLKYIESQGFA